jgi:hypothetical protein
MCRPLLIILHLVTDTVFNKTRLFLSLAKNHANKPNQDTTLWLAKKKLMEQVRQIARSKKDSTIGV